MKTKKLFAMIVALVLCVSLFAGCGSSSQPAATSAPAAPAADSSTDAPAARTRIRGEVLP